jgi:hypothetical protein
VEEVLRPFVGQLKNLHQINVFKSILSPINLVATAWSFLKFQRKSANAQSASNEIEFVPYGQPWISHAEAQHFLTKSLDSNEILKPPLNESALKNRPNVKDLMDLALSKDLKSNKKKQSQLESAIRKNEPNVDPFQTNISSHDCVSCHSATPYLSILDYRLDTNQYSSMYESNASHSMLREGTHRKDFGFADSHVVNGIRGGTVFLDTGGTLFREFSGRL